MSDPSPCKTWPATVVLRIDLCPRCGGTHEDVQFHRFELGDQSFTHWSYCSTTGEPLLFDARRALPKQGQKFILHYTQDDKPWQSAMVASPLPATDASTRKTCKVDFPVVEGVASAWKVECAECGARVVCTGGRRSTELHCHNKPTP